MYHSYLDISFDTFNSSHLERGKIVKASTMPYLALHCAYEISHLNLRCLIGLGGFGQFGNMSNRWIKQKYGVRVISFLLSVFRM